MPRMAASPLAAKDDFFRAEVLRGDELAMMASQEMVETLAAAVVATGAIGRRKAARQNARHRATRTAERQIRQ